MRMRMMTVAMLMMAAGGAMSGCKASGQDHTLVSAVSEAVAPGSCVPIEGPFPVPSGATMDYTVVDIDDTDDMDVAIIDDSLGCNLANGYGVNLDVASVSSGTGDLPDGNYDFVVWCHNLYSSCLFSLSWTATY